MLYKNWSFSWLMDVSCIFGAVCTSKHDAVCTSKHDAVCTSKHNTHSSFQVQIKTNKLTYKKISFNSQTIRSAYRIRLLFGTKAIREEDSSLLQCDTVIRCTIAHISTALWPTETSRTTRPITVHSVTCQKTWVCRGSFRHIHGNSL